jgi:hypothetical protein
VQTNAKLAGRKPINAPGRVEAVEDHMMQVASARRVTGIGCLKAALKMLPTAVAFGVRLYG